MHLQIWPPRPTPLPRVSSEWSSSLLLFPHLGLHPPHIPTAALSTHPSSKGVSQATSPTFLQKLSQRLHPIFLFCPPPTQLAPQKCLHKFPTSPKCFSPPASPTHHGGPTLVVPILAPGDPIPLPHPTWMLLLSTGNAGWSGGWRDE